MNGPFLNADRGRISLDIGCARVLQNRDPALEVVLVLGSDAERAAMLEEGLPSWQAEVDRRP